MPNNHRPASRGRKPPLVSPENFEQTHLAALDVGDDSDIVAAMACSVSQAYHGSARLPPRLVNDLEYNKRLVALADAVNAKVS